jgi:hypothetical protein
MRSKYRNKKTYVGEIAFDSKKEAARYQELKLLEKAGEIDGLALQQRFEILPKHGRNRAVFYVADFVYVKDGEMVVEDCKGFRTDVYKLKKKMFEYKYDIEILET